MPTNNDSRVQNEDRILKAAREKPFRVYQGGTVSSGIRADLSWETDRGQQAVEGDTPNAGVAGNKHRQLGILHPAKLVSNKNRSE